MVFAVLPLYIVALCIMECCVSANPINKGYCPSGWTQFGAYCYRVSGQIKSQPDAKRWCNNKRGDLVKINSAEENEFVLQLVRQKAPSLRQVWIGLEWHTNAFYWSDLSVPAYTSWAQGEPNSNGREPCGHMYVAGHTNLPAGASGLWNDISCPGGAGNPNGIVCKRLP